MGVYWAEMADKNQTERQIQFLKNHLEPDGYVLDLACGTGRHLIPLSQRGYAMVGLDVSANLLKIAKKRWREVQVVRGDMRFLPFKSQAFTTAISMDTSFGYLPSESDDRVSLAEVRRVLFQMGVFVIDVFNREELILKYKEKNHASDWKEYSSFFLKQKRTVNREGDWLFHSWTIRDKANGKLRSFEHSVRLYELDGLQGLLEKEGFSMNKVYGGYDGENFSPNSSRLIMVASAK